MDGCLSSFSITYALCAVCTKILRVVAHDRRPCKNMLWWVLGRLLLFTARGSCAYRWHSSLPGDYWVVAAWHDDQEFYSFLLFASPLSLSTPAIHTHL